MNVTDEMLMAYADGELDRETRDRIASLLEEESELAARLEVFTSTRRLTKTAFEPELSRPVPQSLMAAVEAVARRPARPAIRHKAGRAGRFALPLAASIALAFGLSGYWFGSQSPSSDAVANGTILGRSGLATAVGDLPAGQSAIISLASEETRVTTVADYRVPDGVCRVFDVAMPGSRSGMRGVGCARLGQDWTIDLAISTTPGDTFTPASLGLIESIDAYLDALEAEPLEVDHDPSPPQ